jgi:Immunity protein 31
MRLLASMRRDRRHIQPEPRFRYFEVVRVRMTPRTRAEKIAGLEGAVVGMSLDRKALTYAVALRGGTTWLVHEAELEATGHHDRPETHLDRFTAALAADGPMVG